MQFAMGVFRISSLLYFSVILLCSGIFGSFALTNRKEVRLLEIGKRYGNNIFPLNIQPDQKRFNLAPPKVDRFLRPRSDESDITEKRSDTNNGVWFGPRLGRTIHMNEDSPIWIAVDEYPVEQNQHSNGISIPAMEGRTEEMTFE